MTHAEIKARLSSYLDGDLSPPMRERVGAHLDACAECAGELQSLRSTVDLLRSLSAPEPPMGLATRTLAAMEAARPGGLRAPVARAAVLAGAIALIAVGLARNAPEPDSAPSAAAIAEWLQTEADGIAIEGPLGAGTAPETAPPPAAPLPLDALVDRALVAPLAFVEDWLAHAPQEREPWLERVALRARERGEAARIARGLRASGDPRALELASRFVETRP